MPVRPVLRSSALTANSVYSRSKTREEQTIRGRRKRTHLQSIPKLACSGRGRCLYASEHVCNLAGARPSLFNIVHTRLYTSKRRTTSQQLTGCSSPTYPWKVPLYIVCYHVEKSMYIIHQVYCCAEFVFDKVR